MNLLSVPRTSVDSSHIRAVGHDKKQTLIVEFDAAIWAYTPVSKELYKSLMDAESKGQFFHKNIKKSDTIKGERLQ